MALSSDDYMNLYSKLGKVSGLANLGGGIAGLFGAGKGPSPSDAANKYLNKIPGEINQYYQPYINAGQGALPVLQGQYGDLLNNPGGKFNDIGASFQQSPGFKFALDQALRSAGRAAAAGGMAGSPMHEQQNMEVATNLANQDYYNWLGQAIGLYSQGLSGEQGLYSGGLQAGGSMADQISQQLAQQAANAYQNQSAQNETRGGFLDNIAGGLGTLAAFGGLI